MRTSKKDYDHYMCLYAKNSIYDGDVVVSTAEHRIKELQGRERITNLIDMYMAQRDWYKLKQKLSDRIIRKHCHEEETVSTDANPEPPSGDSGGSPDSLEP